MIVAGIAGQMLKWFESSKDGRRSLLAVLPRSTPPRKKKAGERILRRLHPVMSQCRIRTGAESTAVCSMLHNLDGVQLGWYKAVLKVL